MNTRLIALSDGTSMGGTLLVFKTNAPKELLKELQRRSCDAFITGNGEEDVPFWMCEIAEKGYECEYVAEHGHITPWGTSSSWLEINYPECKERYVIEDQPDLARRVQ